MKIKLPFVIKDKEMKRVDTLPLKIVSRWYHSKTREEECVFNLSSRACTSQYGCWTGCTSPHRKRILKPLAHDFKKKHQFDIAAFGCSFTYGTAIKLDSTYTSLFQKNHDLSVFNFAQEGQGVDSILINLKYAFRHFKMKKVIILLPTFKRKLVRYKNYNGFYRVNVPGTVGFFQEYFDLRSPDILKRYLDVEHLQKYSKRVFSRIKRIFHSQKETTFYVSSWNDRTYGYLESMGIGKSNNVNLLPKFPPNDNLGLDKSHPSEKIHQIWYDQIKDIVINP